MDYKCSSKEHENIEAISYCKKCDIYICNKCETIHSKLCQNHQTYKLNQNFGDIFTGYCMEKGHNEKLEFFCKNHNKLCCASCLCKIKDKGKGQHNNCDVCVIESIQEEKKNKLIENIQNLENLSNTLQDSISKLNIIFKEINENKEKIKSEIQNKFTKLREALNSKEDELLLKVDNIYNKEFFDETLIKESEKLPNKVKISLENCKKLKNNWNNENLYLLIHECTSTEKNINLIKMMEKNINESKKLKYLDIKFIDDKKSQLVKDIKKLDYISIYNSLIDIKDSLILSDNLNFIEIISNWVNPKKSMEAKLLYRKTKDGDSYEIFHKLCDKKGKTLTLIKAENFIIGAYTPIDWDVSHDGWKNDNESFIFSLTNNKIYRKKEKSTESLYCGKNEGPWYGGIGSRNKNMSLGEFQFSRKGYEFYGNIDDIIPNEGKTRFFDIDELEIFQLMDKLY